MEAVDMTGVGAVRLEGGLAVDGRDNRKRFRN